MTFLLKAFEIQWYNSINRQLKLHSEFVLVIELIEWLACKLETIVVNDPPGDTKSVDDMFDEVDHISGFNFSEWCSFRPLWEVIGYRKDEPMTFHQWKTDRSYNIDSPRFEQPWNNCGV